MEREQDELDADIEDPGGITRLVYILGVNLLLPALLFIPVVNLIALILGPAVFATLRMKNAGYHPLLGLLIYIPFINIWPALVCLIAPPGYRYTKKLDTTGMVLGSLVLLVFVGVLAMGIYLAFTQ